MFIVTYGFGDSVNKVPTLGFFIGDALVPVVIDIEFDVNIKRTISFTTTIKRTIDFNGDLS